MSGKAGALELFLKVMLASASIPVAFPAVYIPVVADGKRYEEIDHDGGTATQVFFYGFTLDRHASVQEAVFRGQGRTPVRLYVVRNGKLKRAVATHAPQHLAYCLRLPEMASLAPRSLGTFTASIPLLSGMASSSTWHTSPRTSDIDAKESFDHEAMNRLYQLGYEWARAGYPWQHPPPGLRD